MKALILVIIILLTCYAPIELTRVIYENGLHLRLWTPQTVTNWVPDWQYELEIAVMWFFYLLIIPVYWKLTPKRW